MFFDRSASFLPRPESLSASVVMLVSGTRDQLPALQRAVLERVGRVADLRQVPRGELVGVDDQQAAAGQVGDVGLERGRVHHDQDVGGVARRHDVVVGEVQLEGADAGQGARRRADLGGEVGQRRQVVAEARRLAGEPVARQLHAVAGVAGEPDDDAVELDDALHEAARRGAGRDGVQSSVVYLHRPRLRACVRGRDVDPDTIDLAGGQPARPRASFRRGSGSSAGNGDPARSRWTGRAALEQRTEDRPAPGPHGRPDPRRGRADRRPGRPVHRAAHRARRERLRLLQLRQARAAGDAGLPGHRDAGAAAVLDRARAGHRGPPADAPALREPDEPAQRLRHRPQPAQRRGLRHPGHPRAARPPRAARGARPRALARLQPRHPDQLGRRGDGHGHHLPGAHGDVRVAVRRPLRRPRRRQRRRRAAADGARAARRRRSCRWRSAAAGSTRPTPPGRSCPRTRWRWRAPCARSSAVPPPCRCRRTTGWSPRAT